MTIAAGFVCSDGIVICADTQETIAGYTKTNTDKVRVWKDHGLCIAIAGAGDTESVESLGQLIEKSLVGGYSPTTCRFPDDYRQLIQETVSEFFRTAIVPYAAFPKDERPFADLLITISVLNDVNNYDCLFKVSGTTVREVEWNAECIGSGIILAKSLIERFYNPSLNLDDLIIVACYILFQVKKWTDGCGGNTHIVVASYKHEVFGGIRSAEIRQMENTFETFDRETLPLLTGLCNRNTSAEDLAASISTMRKRLLDEKGKLTQSEVDHYSILKIIKDKRTKVKPTSSSQKSLRHR